jgi:hypothetical protein
MSYKPQLQPPPTTGDAALDQWLKHLRDEVNLFFGKQRETGNGLQYDALDRLEVGFGFMQRNKV